MSETDVVTDVEKKMSPEDEKLLEALITDATVSAAKEVLEEYRGEVLNRAKKKVGEMLKKLEELPS